MIDFLKKTFSEFSADRCTTLAAALAYYTVFSLPPLLFLLVTVVSTSLSAFYESGQAEEKAQSVIVGQVSSMIGNEQATSAITTMMEQSQADGGNWWKSLISLAGIAFGATGVVAALQDSLNRVWSVKPDPEAGGIKYFITKRLLSFGMILGLGFILLVSLLITAVLNGISGQLLSKIGIESIAGTIINYGVQFLMITVVFAAIYKFMPDAVIRWRDVFVGAVVTAILFLIGQFGLHWYLSASNPGEQLGSAAGSLAVVLVWIYYSAIIFLLGAEVTQVYADRYGSGVEPEDNAVKYEERVERTTPRAT